MNLERFDEPSHDASDHAILPGVMNDATFAEAVTKRDRLLVGLAEIQSWLARSPAHSELYSEPHPQSQAEKSQAEKSQAEIVLAALGKLSRASRVYWVETQPNPQGDRSLSQKAEWSADSSFADKRMQPEDAPDEITWQRWAAILSTGSTIHDVVAQFPAAERTFLAKLHVQAMLIVPLQIDGQLWGFVGFENCHQAQLWDVLEVSVLKMAVAAFAVVLERQAVEMQRRQHRDRDRLFTAIATRINQALDLTETLQQTGDDLQHVLHADRVLIYHFDGQHSVLVAASGLPEWRVDGQHAHQIWQHDKAHAIEQHGQTHILNTIDLQSMPAGDRSFLQQIGVQAKLVVPVMLNRSPDSCLWGVVAIHHCATTRQWQPFEIELVEKMAVQLAIAIQQSQLIEQVQHRAQRESLFNQLNQSLSASLDPNHILQQIVNLTGEGFGVDRAVIFTVDQEIQAISEWRDNETVPSMLSFTAPKQGWLDFLETHQPLRDRFFYALDLSQCPMTPTREYQVKIAECKSVLSVPILIHEQLYGALVLYTTTGYRTFAKEDVQLLQRIAAQAAIALYNAQSYDYLEKLVKQRTQELEREKLISETANRAKTEFLATMSHELRTPLNAVLGLSQLLQQEIFGTLTTKQQEYIDQIYSSGEHLLMLINDILDLAKVEAGRETLTCTTISVSELCNYCVVLMQEQAIAQGLELHSQIDPQAVYCYADDRRLKQMLLNLLSNAIKFTPQGSISLVVQKAPDGITFTVADTGIGIPPEKLPLLFQPFSQLDSQLSRLYAGTGLGLALTQKLARLHGGDITVRSVPDQGSQFILYLPNRADIEPMFLTCDSGSRFQPCFNCATRRVLVIENGSSSAVLLHDYLKMSGYQVEYLARDADVLQYLRVSQPDLVLLDVAFANSSLELTLLNQLRRQPDFQNLPVVVITAMAMAGDRDKFLAAGATHYLSKPMDIGQLESVLMQCMA
jgi:signal transduction histidine kinase